MTQAEVIHAAYSIERAKQVLQDYSHYLSPQGKSAIAERIARAQVALDEATGRKAKS